MYSFLHLWRCGPPCLWMSPGEIFDISFKTLWDDRGEKERKREREQWHPFTPSLCPSPSWKTASQHPFKSLLSSAHQLYLRWEDTWEAKEPDSGSGVWLNPDFSCPRLLFSHFDHNCEGDPGSSICRYPHPMGRGDTEHAHGLALWVTSSFPEGVRTHIKPTRSMKTDRCERLKSIRTFSDTIKYDRIRVCIKYNTHTHTHRVINSMWQSIWAICPHTTCLQLIPTYIQELWDNRCV